MKFTILTLLFFLSNLSPLFANKNSCDRQKTERKCDDQNETMIPKCAWIKNKKGGVCVTSEKANALKQEIEDFCRKSTSNDKCFKSKYKDSACGWLEHPKKKKVGVCISKKELDRILFEETDEGRKQIGQRAIGQAREDYFREAIQFE